jgi:hypothetical protein
MTWMKKHWLGLLLAIAVFSVPWVINLRAQAPVPAQFSVIPATLHTACTVIATTTSYCFASDGLWVSLNGAAYTQIGVVAVTGVSSFNGRTGAVVPVASDYPDAVLSVNGKTGIVVLTGTTTSTTTVQ